jgi:hypothetical protein
MEEVNGARIDTILVNLRFEKEKKIVSNSKTAKRVA